MESFHWMIHFFQSQLFVRIPYPTADFSDQTVIITGSNVGLGLEAARHIVGLGAAKVILAVRTISKGEKAAKGIAASVHADKSRIEVWPLDMSNTESIKAFASRAEGLDRLDATILNAGVLSNSFTLLDGVESHIAVNVIGTLLLTCLLLPKMKESAKLTGKRGRLAVVGSEMM
jgi:NAD(P)-dependent dehydrogenase (short-subunit alcohol dehydrogenase family)